MHVIKTGGAVVARPESAKEIAAAWHDRTENWILVHGGGPQLDQALRNVQGPPEKVDGLRVTSTDGAEAVRRTMTLVGADLCKRLRDAGVPAVQIPPDTGALLAVPKTSTKGDLGRVGTATAVRNEAIQAALDAGKLPVVTPVGWDAEGPLNINADEAAAVVAMSVDAHQLVLVTDVPAVLDADSKPLAHLSPSEAKQLMQDGVAEGGMHAKLNQALNAIESGVNAVRIGSIHAAWDHDAGTHVQAMPEAVVRR